MTSSSDVKRNEEEDDQWSSAEGPGDPRLTVSSGSVGQTR